MSDPIEAGPVFDVACGAASDTGCVRGHNEDAYLAERPVFVVADGMGGHSRGEAASAEVVRRFRTLVGTDWVRADGLHTAIAAAAASIDALAGPGAPPGSTVAGVALTEQAGRPYWLAFNVGDSRVYLCRNSSCDQVSVDHSVHQELLERGGPRAAAMAARNVITRALGGGQAGTPIIDQWLLPASVGDRVLICSDGLSNEVDRATLGRILATIPDPAAAARRLVDEALAGGGRDNITAVVVDAVAVRVADWSTDLDGSTTLGGETDATLPEGLVAEDDERSGGGPR